MACCVEPEGITIFAHLDGIAGPVEAQDYCKTQQEMAACPPSLWDGCTDPEHPFLAHYRFLHQAVGDDPQAVAKQTLPSPCMLMYRSLRRNSGLSGVRCLLRRFGTGVRLGVFHAGLPLHLQLDDTFWVPLFVIICRDPCRTG